MELSRMSGVAASSLSSAIACVTSPRAAWVMAADPSPSTRIFRGSGVASGRLQPLQVVRCECRLAAERVDARLDAPHLHQAGLVALESLGERACESDRRVQLAGVEARAERAGGRPFGHLGESAGGGIRNADGEFGECGLGPSKTHSPRLRLLCRIATSRPCPA